MTTNEEIAGVGAEAEPVATAPADEQPVTPAAPTALEQQAQAELNALHEAQQKEAAAEAALDERKTEVRSVQDAIAAERAQVAELEALHELTADQALAQENARRRVRRLTDEDLVRAQQALEDARERWSAAYGVLNVRRRQLANAQLDAMDEDYVRDVQATVARLQEKRGAIDAHLREMWSTWPRGNINRGKISAIPASNAAPLVQAQETVERLDAIRRQQTDGNHPMLNWAPHVERVQSRLTAADKVRGAS